MTSTCSSCGKRGNQKNPGTRCKKCNDDLNVFIEKYCRPVTRTET